MIAIQLGAVTGFAAVQWCGPRGTSLGAILVVDRPLIARRWLRGNRRSLDGLGGLRLDCNWPGHGGRPGGYWAGLGYLLDRTLGWLRLAICWR